jgi:hypothetical protein
MNNDTDATSEIEWQFMVGMVALVKWPMTDLLSKRWFAVDSLCQQINGKARCDHDQSPRERAFLNVLHAPANPSVGTIIAQ